MRVLEFWIASFPNGSESSDSNSAYNLEPADFLENWCLLSGIVLIGKTKGAATNFADDTVEGSVA